MNTFLEANRVDDGRRHRRTHSAQFKARMVAECQHPGVSVAAVALANGLNANLLRRWIVQSQEQAAPVASFVALPLPQAAATPLPAEAPHDTVSQAIRIELRRADTELTVHWPLSSAAACGAWLQGWLRG